jgi:hypothetical protein
MAHNFKVGDKVFLRSNEPDQELVVGLITRFETFGGKVSSPIPVVMGEDGQEWMGGCVRPYNSMDHEVLKDMPAIEQWNFLVADTESHNQLSEKYGVKYKTYK